MDSLGQPGSVKQRELWVNICDPVMGMKLLYVKSLVQG